MNINSHWLGNINYNNSLAKQHSFVKAAGQDSVSRVLGVEHQNVITLGLQSKTEDILASEIQLKQNSIPIFRVKRGGMTVLHSKGQVVIYPVVPVRKLKIKIKNFINIIIDSTVQTLNSFGCSSNFDYQKRGFYTKKGKIAFLGLQFSRGVSMHGVAINVNNNLDLNLLIKPCGNSNEKFDKLSNYWAKIELEEVFNKWLDKFRLRVRSYYS